MSDDRLAAVLEPLSDHQRGQACEGALTQHLLRVYDLQPDRVLERDRCWWMYANNTPPDQLPLSQAVLAYHSQYLVKRDMDRLKGQPLSLTPMYLEWDDYVIGLIQLLSVGFRVLTLVEFVVRWHLATERTALTGLYAGNPKRAPAHPTTERLLDRVQGLTLTIIREGRRRRSHLTPLSRVQRRILALLNFPVDIYMRFCPDSYQPPYK